MENNMFEDIVAEGNIVVIDNYWIVLCKRWRPECYNLFCYLYLHKEDKNLMVGSHFTMTEDKKEIYSVGYQRGTSYAFRGNVQVWHCSQ